MRPLNCCKGCKGLSKDGLFRNILECIMCADYNNELSLKLYNEQKSRRGCSTCANCKHVYEYPSYVIGEECICLAGLECDTVLFKVENCPKWEGRLESEGQ